MRKTVWITGAGSGIGAAMAAAFAGAGFHVALTGRRQDRLREVADALPEPDAALILPGDVTDRAGMARAAQQVADWGGRLDVLCNNAGLNIPKRRWAELDWDSWDRVIDVNLTGALNVIAACLPIMRKQQDGVMIHTSSWAGRFHSPVSGVAYGASKHALSDISLSLNDEEGRNGIRSTALCPAEVATPLLAERPGFDASKMAEMIQPEDMAKTALFVAQMQSGISLPEIVLAPVRRKPQDNSKETIMPHPVKGIDHCFALVNDLDAAADQYRALGFTLSPRGMHSPAKGTANYTIMFPEDYFELLGIVTLTDLNASRREKLAAMGQGLHAIACRIDSAEEAARALGDIGIATEGLGSFSRPVPLPDGSEGVAAFSTVSFTPDETPRGTVFMCQHKTRDTVWIPELLTHANSACGLGAILTQSDTPEEEAARFARLWAEGAVSMKDGFSAVHTGPDSAPLILATAERLQTHYPGLDLSGTARGAFTALRVKVRDPDAVKTCLTDAGITPVETPGGLAVGPEHAAGVLLEFVPE